MYAVVLVLLVLVCLPIPRDESANEGPSDAAVAAWKREEAAERSREKHMREKNAMLHALQVIAKENPETAASLLPLLRLPYEATAIRYIESVKNGAPYEKESKERITAINTILEPLSRRDPAVAWDIFMEYGRDANGQFYQGIRHAIFERWVGKDPQAALQAALTEKDEKMRKRFISEVFSEWAKHNFNDAFQYVNASPDKSIQSIGFRALACEAKGGQRNLVLDAILEHLSAEADEPLRRDAIYELAGSLSRDDPRAAAQAFARLPPGNIAHANAMRRIAGNLAALKDGNESELLQWARTIGDEKARTPVLYIILKVWIDADYKAAATKVEAAKLTGAERAIFNRLMTETLSKKDIPAALKHASKLKNLSEKEFAARTIMRELAYKNPHEALAKLDLLGMKDNHYVVGDIVEVWAGKDAKAATAWVEKLPQGKVKEHALYILSNYHSH